MAVERARSVRTVEILELETCDIHKHQSRHCWILWFAETATVRYSILLSIVSLHRYLCGNSNGETTNGVHTKAIPEFYTTERTYDSIQLGIHFFETESPVDRLKQSDN